MSNTEFGRGGGLAAPSTLPIEQDRHDLQCLMLEMLDDATCLT